MIRFSDDIAVITEKVVDPERSIPRNIIRIRDNVIRIFSITTNQV